MIIKKHVKIGISRAIGTILVFGSLAVMFSLLVTMISVKLGGTFSTEILGARFSVESVNDSSVVINGTDLELTNEQKNDLRAKAMKKLLNKEE